MNSLSEYVYKKVKIITKDDKLIIGDVVGYFNAIENDYVCDAISINYGEYYRVVEEDEIKKIVIVKD